MHYICSLIQTSKWSQSSESDHSNQTSTPPQDIDEPECWSMNEDDIEMGTEGDELQCTQSAISSSVNELAMQKSIWLCLSFCYGQANMVSPQVL